MPQFLFAVFAVVIAVTGVVAVMMGFSLYVLGAEGTIAFTWDWKTYSSIEEGFTIRHPEGAVADPHHAYNGLGRAKEIYGTAFLMPLSMTQATNLSRETRLSVEKLPHAIDCTASLFLYLPKAQKEFTEDGVTYSFAAEREVRNGAVREERVYAFKGSSPCIAVRYQIHAALIETDDVAAVTEYDHARLMDTLDAMRRSVTFIRE